MRAMSSAFVTGATGFIGGHVASELAQRGWRVQALVRNPAKAKTLQAAGVEIVSGDLTDVDRLTETLAGVQAVFHLAGITRAVTRAEFHTSNAEGVGAIAQACARQPNPPTLVICSSIAAAGPAQRGQPRTEEQAARPMSDYGRSKLAGESLAREYADRVPIAIVRPGVVFGPADPASLDIFKSIQRTGFHVYPRWRTPPLSVIYAPDLAKVMLTASAQGERLPANNGSDSSCGRGIYNVCRDEYPTYHQFGWLAAQALGRNWFLPLPLTPPLPFIVGAIGETGARLRRKASLINLDKMREATVPSWECSSAKAQRDLNLSHSGPLLDQMRETVAWYRQEKWL